MLKRKAKDEPAGKCWTCTGTGTEIVWLSKGGKTVQVEITCTDCRGTGERP
jgi:DnaJ-class molecular chaperone